MEKENQHKNKNENPWIYKIFFYDMLPVFQEALHLQKKTQLSQEH